MNYGKRHLLLAALIVLTGLLPSYGWKFPEHLEAWKDNGLFFMNKRGIVVSSNSTDNIKWSMPNRFVSTGIEYEMEIKDGWRRTARNRETREIALSEISSWEFPDHRTAVEVVCIFPTFKSSGFEDVIVKQEGDTLYIVNDGQRNYAIRANVGIGFKYEGKEPRTPEKMMKFLKAILDAGIRAAEESSTGKDAGS